MIREKDFLKIRIVENCTMEDLYILCTKDFAELIKRSSTYARTVLNGLADKGILKKVELSTTDPHQ